MQYRDGFKTATPGMRKVVKPFASKSTQRRESISRQNMPSNSMRVIANNTNSGDLRTEKVVNHNWTKAQDSKLSQQRHGQA